VVLRDPEGGEWLASLLGRADFVGEMALLTGQDRTAMIRAADTSLLQKVLKSDFQDVCDLDPNLSRALSEYMGSKL
jgi:CRP-like cAMP-binding protein